MADKNVLLRDSSGNNLYPQIAAKSVTTNKLADGSVTKAKLADDISFASITNTTWYELKCLRDTGKLTPGMQYRITDYQCTTKQENTQSAGHQFDIIVTADSANKLNEKARACLHDGNTYFKDCNLAAWEIWYSLDNDTSRFRWADNDASIAKVTSGSNTYYLYKIADPANLKNQDGTDMSYTFFKNYNLNDNTLYALINSRGNYYFNKVDIDSQGYITSKDNLGNYSSGTKEELLATYPNAVVCEVGHGVIYRMIDEWHNDCPYDFKNIIYTINGQYGIYTFWAGADGMKNVNNQKVLIKGDITLKGYTFNNIIKGLDLGLLPFIYFEQNSITFENSYNTIGVNCYNIHFLGSNINNNIYQNCHDIQFTMGVSNSTILPQCSNISMNVCTSTIIGSLCKYLSIEANSALILPGVKGTSSNILDINTLNKTNSVIVGYSSNNGIVIKELNSI